MDINHRPSLTRAKLPRKCFSQAQLHWDARVTWTRKRRLVIAETSGAKVKRQRKLLKLEESCKICTYIYVTCLWISDITRNVIFLPAPIHYTNCITKITLDMYVYVDTLCIDANVSSLYNVIYSVMFSGIKIAIYRLSHFFFPLPLITLVGNVKFSLLRLFRRRKQEKGKHFVDNAASTSAFT